ncbi:hypothetical protein SESBI_33034 [Sesbania bispinosa]|nr:hypothetical protein SESBI_33034 [Sesbania bispinosa]
MVLPSSHFAGLVVPATALHCNPRCHITLQPLPESAATVKVLSLTGISSCCSNHITAPSSHEPPQVAFLCRVCTSPNQFPIVPLRSGFQVPLTPFLKDPRAIKSRMDKILRAILHKKLDISPRARSSTTTTDNASKWVTTNSEYIGTISLPTEESR